jgi:hypothetical protein
MLPSPAQPGRTDAAALAGESHDERLAAARALCAGESEAEDAALEIAAEFLLDVSRHGPLGGFPPGEPAFEVLRHNSVERGLLRAAPLVATSGTMSPRRIAGSLSDRSCSSRRRAECDHECGSHPGGVPPGMTSVAASRGKASPEAGHAGGLAGPKPRRCRPTSASRPASSARWMTRPAARARVLGAGGGSRLLGHGRHVRPGPRPLPGEPPGRAWGHERPAHYELKKIRDDAVRLSGWF